MRASPTRLAVQGVLAVAIGVVAIVWPDITIGAFVILYAVWAFVDAAFNVMAAVAPPAGAEAATSTKVGHGVLAAVDVLAGVLAIVWPDITALALVLLVAAWALVAGVLQVRVAFRAGESAGERTFFVLTGLLSVALGIAFVLRPDIGAVTIAAVYGFFSIVTGVALLMTAWSIRSARSRANAALQVG
ncbi:hypothetical protein GCM10027053_16270 [Intrasporangium mesophilum]